MWKKRRTREIRLGGLIIGGDRVPVVQSMAKTDTRDVSATITQIRELEELGCEAIRVAVLDLEAAKAIGEIKKGIHIPLIADIHFDPALALESIRSGADGIRINPGNIGGREGLRKIVELAKGRGTAIRIGVNSGSLGRELLKKYSGPTPEAMVESALSFVKMVEEMEFFNLKISLKSSNVLDTVRAYELISERLDYPLHIGITETGTLLPGTVKSAVGISSILMKGIGDTIRVSLCSDPKYEIMVAYEILRSLEIRKRGPELIACPTCGRCEIDLQWLAQEVEKRISDIKVPIKVAVMGCVVNGPGEA
ncbi:MAG: flavodoxin-dependent (E)-4-hydroxy-3-methylbut-2-enyl-diphosphate synthase, partial [Desulfatiglandales bacterium]